MILRGSFDENHSILRKSIISKDEEFVKSDSIKFKKGSSEKRKLTVLKSSGEEDSSINRNIKEAEKLGLESNRSDNEIAEEESEDENDNVNFESQTNSEKAAFISTSSTPYKYYKKFIHYSRVIKDYFASSNITSNNLYNDFPCYTELENNLTKNFSTAEKTYLLNLFIEMCNCYKVKAKKKRKSKIHINKNKAQSTNTSDRYSDPGDIVTSRSDHSSNNIMNIYSTLQNPQFTQNINDSNATASSSYESSTRKVKTRCTYKAFLKYFLFSDNIYIKRLFLFIFSLCPSKKLLMYLKTKRQAFFNFIDIYDGIVEQFNENPSNHSDNEDISEVEETFFHNFVNKNNAQNLNSRKIISKILNRGFNFYSFLLFVTNFLHIIRENAILFSYILLSNKCGKMNFFLNYNSMTANDLELFLHIRYPNLYDNQKENFLNINQNFYEMNENNYKNSSLEEIIQNISTKMNQSNSNSNKTGNPTNIQPINPFNTEAVRKKRENLSNSILKFINSKSSKNKNTLSFLGFVQFSYNNPFFLTYFHPILNHFRRCIFGIDFWVLKTRKILKLNSSHFINFYIYYRESINFYENYYLYNSNQIEYMKRSNKKAFYEKIHTKRKVTTKGSKAVSIKINRKDITLSKITEDDDFGLFFQEYYFPFFSTINSQNLIELFESNNTTEMYINIESERFCRYHIRDPVTDENYNPLYNNDLPYKYLPEIPILFYDNFKNYTKVNDNLNNFYNKYENLSDKSSDLNDDLSTKSYDFNFNKDELDHFSYYISNEITILNSYRRLNLSFFYPFLYYTKLLKMIEKQYKLHLEKNAKSNFSILNTFFSSNTYQNNNYSSNNNSIISNIPSLPIISSSSSRFGSFIKINNFNNTDRKSGRSYYNKTFVEKEKELKNVLSDIEQAANNAASRSIENSFIHAIPETKDTMPSFLLSRSNHTSFNLGNQSTLPSFLMPKAGDPIETRNGSYNNSQNLIAVMKAVSEKINNLPNLPINEQDEQVGLVKSSRISLDLSSRQPNSISLPEVSGSKSRKNSIGSSHHGGLSRASSFSSQIVTARSRGSFNAEINQQNNFNYNLYNNNFSQEDIQIITDHVNFTNPRDHIKIIAYNEKCNISYYEKDQVLYFTQDDQLELNHQFNYKGIISTFSTCSLPPISMLGGYTTSLILKIILKMQYSHSNFLFYMDKTLSDDYSVGSLSEITPLTRFPTTPSSESIANMVGSYFKQPVSSSLFLPPIFSSLSSYNNITGLTPKLPSWLEPSPENKQQLQALQQQQKMKSKYNNYTYIKSLIFSSFFPLNFNFLSLLPPENDKRYYISFHLPFDSNNNYPLVNLKEDFSTFFYYKQNKITNKKLRNFLKLLPSYNKNFLFLEDGYDDYHQEIEEIDEAIDNFFYFFYENYIKSESSYNNFFNILDVFLKNKENINKFFKKNEEVIETIQEEDESDNDENMEDEQNGIVKLIDKKEEKSETFTFFMNNLHADSGSFAPYDRMKSFTSIISSDAATISDLKFLKTHRIYTEIQKVSLIIIFRRLRLHIIKGYFNKLKINYYSYYFNKLYPKKKFMKLYNEHMKIKTQNESNNEGSSTIIRSRKLYLYLLKYNFYKIFLIIDNRRNLNILKYHFQEKDNQNNHNNHQNKVSSTKKFVKNDQVYANILSYTNNFSEIKHKDEINKIFSMKNYNDLFKSQSLK